MKKILFLLAITLTLVNQGWSQNYKPEDYIRIFGKLDTLLLNYEKYSRLKEIGADVIEDAAVDKFKSLFTEDATIEDELLPQYFDFNGQATFENAWNFKKRTLQEYIDITRNQFPGGLFVNITGTNISLNQIDKGYVYVVLKKKSAGEWSAGGGLRIESTVNVELYIEIQRNGMDVKIKESSIKTDESSPKFEKQIPNFKVYGDDDRDFRANKFDNCEDMPSFASKDGCPTPVEEEYLRTYLDYTFDPRLNFDLSFFGGIVKPKFDFTDSLIQNYRNSQVFSASNKSIDPTVSMSAYGAELSASYFFDRRRKIGFGLGIQYQLIKGEIKADSFQVSYTSPLERFDNYDFTTIRTVSSASFTENFSASMISIPLVFKYRNKISKKFKYEISAGAIWNLSFSGTSTVSDNFIDYTSSIVNPKDINQICPAGESSNFDVGLKQRPTEGKSDFTFTGGLGWMVKPSIYYTLSHRLSLNLGMLFMFNSINNSAEADKYKVTDHVGEYTTMMNGIPKISNQNYFLNLGLRFSIN